MIDKNEVKNISINDYLQRLGYVPHRSSSSINTKYLSPFRNESSPSFCVKNNVNKWKDWGNGEHGDIIDLAMKFNNCSFNDACNILSRGTICTFTPTEFHKEKKESVHIHDVRDINNERLIDYMVNKRKVDYDLVMMYCCEVDFSFPQGKRPSVIHTAIGFENDLHGFELRDNFWKVNTDKKCYTSFKSDGAESHIFEGFISFLSVLQLLKKDRLNGNMYVLNGVELLNILIPFLSGTINCYTDNDVAGDKVITKLIENGFSVNDTRNLYEGFNDANDKLIL